MAAIYEAAKRKKSALADWMVLAMDFLEPADGYMGVDLRGFKLGVAQDLLDTAQISPTFQHGRGHGVAKDMASTWLGDTSSHQVFS